MSEAGHDAIRVAIIGAGIGAEHLAAYQELPSRFQVGMLCDTNRQRATDVASSVSSIEIATDMAQALDSPDIDLVDICLPPHLHFDACVAALRKGKHVICEKPLVGSLKEAEKLTDEVNKSGKMLSPVFQYRYGLATARLHALIEAGLAGKPYVASLETHWNRPASYYDNAWRGTWSGEQGGAIFGHAIHSHDLLCTFFGNVKRLSAMTATRVNDIETEDCATVSFEMENGALATSSVTLGAADDTSRLRFCFEHLTAQSGTKPYAPADDAWTFSARGNASQQAIDECVAAIDHAYNGYAGFFNALANAMHTKSGYEVTLDDGRRSIELVSAIYYSAHHAEVVDLPLAPSHPYFAGWTDYSRGGTLRER